MFRLLLHRVERNDRFPDVLLCWRHHGAAHHQPLARQATVGLGQGRTRGQHIVDKEHLGTPRKFILRRACAIPTGVPHRRPAPAAQSLLRGAQEFPAPYRSRWATRTLGGSNPAAATRRSSRPTGQ